MVEREAGLSHFGAVASVRGSVVHGEDFKFGIEHFSDIERLAMVGETKWQQGMAAFCKPFTKATVRYFDHGNADEPRTWLGET